mmetsp:Transcript_121683/g.192687  ORF Transcript_121683/g.192687 Transcript_121683/m.192687 type:complete len:380 (-) Transcript_121683:32-1171(-)|eukprot:CAMPEP_0169256632 /NCGR_PEP_ID=MMETSP1016-20121227/40382_1 /TAXON_ID=342587 /ORGANISM="Karlodinium micrum, Strain CCMP2283" /LENGTH=379 /DNA_ID=CAMNT_0009338313 /DNA_START=27 /DNA_END=1166 /DNA_ORIENTATION=+
MGAQASSVKGSRANRSSGFVNGTSDAQVAAPFAPSESPLSRCAPPCRNFPSTWQAEDLEAGYLSNEEGTCNVRQSSKMSVRSFESHAMPPEPPSRMETVSGNNNSSLLDSTSDSFCMPRSVSTPHLAGEVLNAQQCYARHLDDVHRGKWADRWAIPTPSTASPSRAPSRCSQSSSSLSRSSYDSILSGSRPGSSSDCLSNSSSRGKDPMVKAQLKDARHRAKASFEALQSELRGSGPVRYSTWPMGCAVRVSFDGPIAVGGVNDSSDSGLLAVLVRHNPSEKTFEVKLHDGSTRVVPERCVTRMRRGSRLQSVADPSCQASRVASRKQEASIVESPAQIVHKALGHCFSKPEPPQRELDRLSMHPLPYMLGSSQLPCKA